MRRIGAYVASALLIAATAGCQQTASNGGQSPAAATAALDHTSIGVRLLAANQPNMALTSFNRALGEDGPTAEALTGAAIANMRIGRGGVAVRLLESAIGVDNDYAPAHNNLGVALYDEGDYIGALAAFQRAHQLTGGTDNAVATNLDMAEFVIADTAATTPQLDEAEFDVILYGNGLYRLERRAKPRPAAAPESRS